MRNVELTCIETGYYGKDTYDDFSLGFDYDRAFDMAVYEMRREIGFGLYPDEKVKVKDGYCVSFYKVDAIELDGRPEDEDELFEQLGWDDAGLIEKIDGKYYAIPFHYNEYMVGGTMYSEKVKQFHTWDEVKKVV